MISNTCIEIIVMGNRICDRRRLQKYEAALEVGKLYRVINDEQPQANGLLRVVDESGEDYAFSSERFYPVPLPQNVEAVLLAS